MSTAVQLTLIGTLAESLAPHLREFPIHDPALTLSGSSNFFCVLIADRLEGITTAPFQAAVVFGDHPSVSMDQLPTLILPASAPLNELATSIRSFIDILSRRKDLNQTSRDIDELHEIGISLASERDIDKLLNMILEKSRLLLVADAATIFLAEGGTPDQPTHLRFKLAQNESVPIQFSEVVIPINEKSLAGYVATTRESLRIDDVYAIPVAFPFRFYGAVDEKTGYRSRSLLSVPMVDHRGHLIGVVQIWNKKKSPSVKEVIPFTSADQKLLASVAAQAGVSIENARLYEEINNLFKGFIRASVKAIEARDPTTSGHSERVSKLTIGLARIVDRTETGPYREARFNDEQLRELEYAALLHDFGKIGVRESVLVKAKKLYPMEYELIQTRLALLHRTLQLRLDDAFITHLIRMFRGAETGDLTWDEVSNRLKQGLGNLVEAKKVISLSNEPTVLPENISRELFTVGGLKLELPDGSDLSVLDSEQILRLSVRKGSLSDEEREEIESHVTYTYKFLEQIPWTRDLSNIPSIAYAHHEKLNGSGYPRGLKSEQIPLPSKIMTVVDIFDALTARDRPYKKAIPVPRAIEILAMEVKAGQLDSELFRMFVEARVYDLTAHGD